MHNMHSGTRALEHLGTWAGHSGTRALGHSGTRALRHSGTHALMHSGTQALRHSGTQALRHSGTQALRHSGTQALRHSTQALRQLRHVASASSVGLSDLFLMECFNRQNTSYKQFTLPCP
jgi:hypothetical protein